jgi:hypothetical protein
VEVFELVLTVGSGEKAGVSQHTNVVVHGSSRGMPSIQIAEQGGCRE